jgi:hypothetical protein
MKLIMLVVVVLGFYTNSVFAGTDDVCISTSPKITGGSGVGAWPWGNEVDFPWTKIQGVWSTNDSSCSSLFIFKPLAGGQIEITQYDPNSCEVLATGKGKESTKTGRVIKARMVKDGTSYDVTIRAFENQDSRTNKKAIFDGSDDSLAIVVSLYPSGKWHKQSNFTIKKVQNSTRMVCNE